MTDSTIYISDVLVDFDKNLRITPQYVKIKLNKARMYENLNLLDVIKRNYPEYTISIYSQGGWLSRCWLEAKPIAS